MKQNRASYTDQEWQTDLMVNSGWALGLTWQALCGGLWLFFFAAFSGFVVQYWRYYYKGYYAHEKAYAKAYDDMEKIARQIVIGFMLFLAMTYSICTHSYNEWLESLKMGVIFNMLLSPVYYHYFGDRREWKFKKIKT